MMESIKHTIDRVRRRYGFDRELCAPCENVGLCSHPCIFLTYIDGNVGRKENFLRSHMLNHHGPDYKEVLGDLSDIQESEHGDIPRFQKAIMIKDERERLICLGLIGHISQRSLAKHLHLSTTTMNRIIQAMLDK